MPKYLHENGIDIITPKNPQKKNPLRRAMKGKSQSTIRRLAKQSLENARIQEVKEWAKQNNLKKDRLWTQPRTQLQIQ